VKAAGAYPITSIILRTLLRVGYRRTWNLGENLKVLPKKIPTALDKDRAIRYIEDSHPWGGAFFVNRIREHKGM
jgi:hypothetical protein